MDGKFLTKETKDLIVKVGDELIKLPFYLEPFDGSALRIVVNFIDTKADKFVPDELDPIINKAIQEAFNGNYDVAYKEIGTALNIVVDVPLLEEDAEQMMFVEGVRFIITIIKNWIENKKQ